MQQIANLQWPLVSHFEKLGTEAYPCHLHSKGESVVPIMYPSTEQLLLFKLSLPTKYLVENRCRGRCAITIYTNLLESKWMN